MEKYSSGRRGAPAKGIGRVTGARVQIPLSPLLFAIYVVRIFLKKLLTCNLKWHKYNDTAGSPQNYNLQLDKLEIFAQSCIKTFDDIIYGHELDVPTDIIETKLGVGLNNISTVATGVFAVQLIPFGVIALIIISAVLNQMWIITWLILGILLTIIIGPIVLISRAKKAVENSRSVILRFKIPPG